MKRFVIISILLVGVSCALVDTIANYKKPTVKTTDPEIKNLSFDDVNLSFDVIIDNPNPLSIKMSHMEYDVIVEKEKLVSGAKKNGLDIKGNGESKIAIPIEIKFSDVFKAVGNVLSTNEIKYSVEAKTAFNIPVLGDITIPINVDGKIPVPRIPTINVQSLKKKSLSFSGAEFELMLRIDNPNVFPVDLSNLTYSFDVNSKSLVNGKTVKQTINCPKGKETNIPIKIKLDLLTLGTSAYQMLKNGKDLDYSFNTSFDFGTSLPYLKSKKLSFKDAGKLDIL